MVTTRPRRKKAGNSNYESKPKTKAKAKAKKATPLAQMWKDHEWHQLLAYIQWSAEGEKDFWNVPFHRFNRAIESEFSRQRVRVKLARECSRYGWRTPDMTWKDLLTQGLRDLCLPPYVKAEVERLVDEVRHSESSSYNGSTEIATQEHEEGHDGHRVTKKNTRIVTIRTPSRNSRAGGAARKASPGVIDVPDDSYDELSSFIPPNDVARSAGDMPAQRAEIPRTQICDGILESQNKEINSLKNQNFLLANENVGLKEELRTLKQCNPDVGAKRQLEKMFEDLQSRSQRNLSFDMDRRGLQKEKITRSYETLYSNIRDACLDLVQVDGELPGRNHEFSRSAQSWARRIFNRDLVTCVQDIRDEKLSKDELLTGIIARAVIELVFVPAFPNVLTTEGPLKDHYRGIILLSNGPDELHKADLSILSSLMQNRKEVLENKEKELTELITRNLECFWTPQNTKQVTQQSPDGDVMMLDGLVCNSFLTSALDFKLELTGSLTRLQHFPIKPYVTLYDDRTMRRASGSNFGSNVIKACFLPVLLFAQRRVKKMTSSGYVLEHDVHYNTYFTEATEEEVQSLELAAKAIVLT